MERQPVDPLMISQVRKTLPKIMAEDIVSVQPMNMGKFKMRVVRWYHKLMDSRYWKMGYRMVTGCHQGKHTMRHSCWTHEEYCELCFTHNPKEKTGYKKIFNRIFGGKTWRF